MFASGLHVGPVRRINASQRTHLSKTCLSACQTGHVRPRRLFRHLEATHTTARSLYPSIAHDCGAHLTRWSAPPLRYSCTVLSPAPPTPKARVFLASFPSTSPPPPPCCYTRLPIPPSVAPSVHPRSFPSKAQKCKDVPSRFHATISYVSSRYPRPSPRGVRPLSRARLDRPSGCAAA